jgi:MFS family permease
VFGWVYAAHQLGAAIAAFGAGYIRDVFGSYQPAFMIAGVACIVAAAAVPNISPRKPVSPVRADLAVG